MLCHKVYLLNVNSPLIILSMQPRANYRIELLMSRSSKTIIYIYIHNYIIKKETAAEFVRYIKLQQGIDRTITMNYLNV